MDGKFAVAFCVKKSISWNKQIECGTCFHNYNKRGVAVVYAQIYVG